MVFTCLRGMVSAGVSGLALEWIAERLQAEPERKFYYQVQFSLYQALGRRDMAQAAMESWEKQSGEKDPDMVRALEEMKARALQEEQRRIEEAVGRSGGQ